MKDQKYFILLFLNLSLLFSLSAQNLEGDLQRWHKLSLTFNGPNTSEQANPNPFTDYNMEVNFTHTATNTSYKVLGFYAACGTAEENSCESGNKWRAHFSPDRTGNWTWEV